jgi:hypothetical protein
VPIGASIRVGTYHDYLGCATDERLAISTGLIVDPATTEKRVCLYVKKGWTPDVG